MSGEKQEPKAVAYRPLKKLKADELTATDLVELGNIVGSNIRDGNYFGAALVADHLPDGVQADAIYCALAIGVMRQAANLEGDTYKDARDALTKMADHFTGTRTRPRRSTPIRRPANSRS